MRFIKLFHFKNTKKSSIEFSLVENSHCFGKYSVFNDALVHKPQKKKNKSHYFEVFVRLFVCIGALCFKQMFENLFSAIRFIPIKSKWNLPNIWRPISLRNGANSTSIMRYENCRRKPFQSAFQIFLNESEKMNFLCVYIYICMYVRKRCPSVISAALVEDTKRGVQNKRWRHSPKNTCKYFWEIFGADADTLSR